MIVHKSKKEQQIQSLFGGKFTENKPIPFPTYEKNYAYSNLFYWAHLEAHKTGEFPLHPHEGFEIMTFVLKGSIEHFDTATNKWTPIEEGGFQIIQAGTGVMHAEKILKGSELFQIWFDPDFSKSLKTSAAYQDYTHNDAFLLEENGAKVLEYAGLKSSVMHQTNDIRITRELLENNCFSKSTNKSSVHSIYVIQGSGKIASKSVSKDDFIVIDDVEQVEFETNGILDIFVIKTPKNLTYKRYRE